MTIVDGMGYTSTVPRMTSPALKKFKQRNKEIYLRYKEGYSFAEIARLHNVSREWIRRIVRNAKLDS